MERATRYGSYVPIKTIGIAQFSDRGQRATNPPARLQVQSATSLGAPKADVVDIPHMTWFASIRMLLRHFSRKVALHGPARRFPRVVVWQSTLDLRQPDMG